jgi:O-antigen/teichoic acid export membrane protein
MSVRRSLAWAFSAQFITFLVQFGGSVIIARLLSPTEIGIYVIAMAALGIVQVVTTFGIIPYIIREAEVTSETLEVAFTINALLVVALSIILTALSFAAGPILGAREAGPVLRLLALGNLLAIFSFRSLAMLQREMRFKQVSLITATSSIVQTVVTIGFALEGASYMSAAYGSLAASVLTTALAMHFGRQFSGYRLSLRRWRPITKFGLQIMAVNGVAQLNGRISELLVGRILGVTALGLYARATGLSTMIFANLYGTATRVLFVRFSRAYHDQGDWRGIYLRSFAIITAFMWPLLVGLAVLSQPVVLLLYGEAWLPAALPLSAMMIGQVIGIAFGFNWELFVLRGEIGRQSRYEIARFIIGMPIFVVGCLFSVLAATIAKIADAMIGLALYYPHVRRLAELDPYDIPRIYRDSAALTFAAVLPAVIVMINYDWSPRTPLPIIGAAIAAGGALWLAVIAATRHPVLDELLLLRGKIFQRRRVAEDPAGF